MIHDVGYRRKLRRCKLRTRKLCKLWADSQLKTRRNIPCTYCAAQTCSPLLIPRPFPFGKLRAHVLCAPVSPGTHLFLYICHPPTHPWDSSLRDPIIYIYIYIHVSRFYTVVLLPPSIRDRLTYRGSRRREQREAAAQSTREGPLEQKL